MTADTTTGTRFHLYIEGLVAVDEAELFPDGTPHGGPATLDDVDQLLQSTSLRTFLSDWNYEDVIEVTFRAPDGALLDAYQDGRYVGRRRSS